MSAEKTPSATSRASHCYAVSAMPDDDKPVTIQWVDESCETWIGELVEVKPIAINDWFDGIEIWDRPMDGDDCEPDGVLALHKFPITRGDVRRVCAALGIKSA